MFRLTALFVAVVSFIEPVRADQAETEAEVVKLGGTAKVVTELDESARVWAIFRTATDDLLIQLAKRPEIGALRIDDATKCTEKGLIALRELPNLQKLMLGRCPLTDAKAAALGTLRTLDLLHVGESRLTDAGLTALKKLSNLTSLDLLDAPLTDKAVPVLLGFKKLQELNLAGTKVTDSGIPNLAPLANLKTLKLHNTAVTRKGIDAIEKALPKLTVRW